MKPLEAIEVEVKFHNRTEIMRMLMHNGSLLDNNYTLYDIMFDDILRGTKIPKDRIAIDSKLYRIRKKIFRFNDEYEKFLRYEPEVKLKSCEVWVNDKRVFKAYPEYKKHALEKFIRQAAKNPASPIFQGIRKLTFLDSDRKELSYILHSYRNLIPPKIIKDYITEIIG